MFSKLNLRFHLPTYVSKEKGSFFLCSWTDDFQVNSMTTSLCKSNAFWVFNRSFTSRNRPFVFVKGGLPFCNVQHQFITWLLFVNKLNLLMKELAGTVFAFQLSLLMVLLNYYIILSGPWRQIFCLCTCI